MDDQLMTREKVGVFLHVSRPYVDKLLACGALRGIREPVSGQWRISKEAAAEYKRQMKGTQQQGIAKMIQASEELGLYDNDLLGTPPKE